MREQHKFLWEPDDKADSWEKKLAKTYNDHLFKEYIIADLSRYEENKIALQRRRSSRAKVSLPAGTSTVKIKRISRAGR